MFTGIIETLGHVVSVVPHGTDTRMVIAADTPGWLAGSAPGDSIAVSGVCLTAIDFPTPDAFTADLSVETLDNTTARTWAAGRAVNLERALTMGKALGGHLVSGHVDGLARLESVVAEERSWRLVFSAPAPLARYIARKGSVTLDGISLTVNHVAGERFGVNIIPHTWTHTTLGRVGEGGQVNLEVDLVARYLERLMTAGDPGKEA